MNCQSLKYAPCFHPISQFKSIKCLAMVRKQQAVIKKHRHKNGAVQKPSFIFPPFQAWEAQTFLSVPSRLFSLPAARHGYSLGKTARRELIVGLGYCIRDSLSKQVPHIDIDTEAAARRVKRLCLFCFFTWRSLFGSFNRFLRLLYHFYHLFFYLFHRS